MNILRILLVVIVSVFPASAFSQQVETSNFAYASELAINGFQPFPVSSVANASFGMMNEADMYICFIADTPEKQKKRQKVIIAALKDDAKSRELPNIDFVCILVQ